MNSKKKSQRPNEKDTGKTLMGKKHEDSKQNEENKNANENRIEITDNPGETERKIPRMKH
jgi:hypothetical protein